MSSFTDHAALIEFLGGAAEVAAFDEVGTLAVNVRAWSARNRIPTEYWPGVIAMAAKRGTAVTAEWLMQTTPPRRRQNDRIEDASDPASAEGAPPPFPNPPHRTDVPAPRAATNQPLPKVVSRTSETSSTASSPKNSPARSAASSAGCAGSDALDDREAA